MLNLNDQKYMMNYPLKRCITCLLLLILVLLQVLPSAHALAFVNRLIQNTDSSGVSVDQIPETVYQMANDEYYRGNTERAITLALQAMNACLKRNDTAGALRAKILAGDILRGNELFDQSADYLTGALKEAILLRDSSLIAEAFNRMAALGADDVRTPRDTAAMYAIKSLEIARRIRDDRLVYNNLNILGVLEIGQKNYNQSLEYLQEALTLAQKTFLEDEPLILHNMARNYFILGRTNDAVELEMRALDLATKLNIPQYIRLSSSYLKDHYNSIGNYAEALKYTIQYYDAKDFILTQKVLVQVKEFNSMMEIEKQRSLNNQLLLEQELTKSRLQNVMIAGILLILLLAVTAGFLLHQRRQRQKIRNIAARLDQSNKVLTRFISVLGHDLRSPFNAILGFTDILKNEPEDGMQDREMIIGKLHDVSRSTFRLLESILEWSRVQSGNVQPVLKTFDLMEPVRETLRVLEPVAQMKTIRVRFDDPGPVMITSDQNIMFTIIRNLVTNAIKFSHPGGLIEIFLTRDTRTISLSVRDQGIGISPENQKMLFLPEKSFKRHGTKGETGTGLGLVLCRDYLFLIGGELQLQSEEGKGCTFSILLPVSD